MNNNKWALKKKIFLTYEAFLHIQRRDKFSSKLFAKESGFC